MIVPKHMQEAEMRRDSMSPLVHGPAAPTFKKRFLDWTRSPPPPTITPFQQFVRDVDWKSTSLGPMDTWPDQLRQMVMVIVADKGPAVVYWGDDNTMIYNEAFVPLVGQKHPKLQGQTGELGLPEIWPQFAKIIEEGRETGLTSVGGKEILFLQRHGFLEETYFDWKFIPVIGDKGYVTGSYSTVTERTREVISDRRMQTVRDLSKHMAQAKDITGVWTHLLQGLEANDKAIPLALLYSVQSVSDIVPFEDWQHAPNTTVCVLEGTIGVPKGHPAAPHETNLLRGNQGFVEAFRRSTKSDSPILLQTEDGTLPQKLLANIEWRGFGSPVKQAVVCPIRSGSNQDLMAFLLIGLNPRKEYDDDYRDFVHLITKQITSPHVSAVLLAEEIKRSESAAKLAASERADLAHQLMRRTQEFEQSEMKFSRFADRAAVGLGIISPDGMVQYANDTWYELLALDPDNHNARPWLDCVVEEDHDEIESMWEKVSNEKSSVTRQIRFKKPWESPCGTMQAPYSTGLCAVYADLNDDGSIKTIMSCIMNISELKWTEGKVRERTRELEHSELKYRQFADHAPLGVCLITLEGQMEFANDAWFAITSESRETTDPTGWLGVFHPDDGPKISKLCTDLKARKGIITVESRLNKMSPLPSDSIDDNHAWVLCSGYPELNSDGTVKNIVVWLTDISAQKGAERGLRKKMDEAIELKRQQENFIDMISHEIRNPLSAVLHCADEIISTLNECLSLTPPPSPKTANGAFCIYNPNIDKLKSTIENTVDAAETIAYCVQHQKRIVDDVLTLSKLDSALLTIAPTAVQPAMIVQDALKMFEGELRTADISLTFHQDRSMEELNIDWLLLDPSRILQVLINLTTNAIKFTRDQTKRKITVKIAASLKRPSEVADGIEYFPQRKSQQVTEPSSPVIDPIYLSLAVQDTGRGLSQDEKKLLFNRFSQGSPKTHVKYGGSGLGLFISRQLTEMQGGEIGVTSERGKGSKFMFFVKTERTSPFGRSSPELKFPTKALKKMSISAESPKRLGQLVPSPQFPPPLKSSNSFPGPNNTPITVSGHTTMSLFPPQAQAHRKRSIPSIKADSPPPTDLKILIVEDNLVNQKVLSKQLRNRGYLVGVANHGREALEALQKTTVWVDDDQKQTGVDGNKQQERDFDVILMDLEMPVMNGMTCVKRIRELEQEGTMSGHTPVIAVTANVRGEHVQAAMEAGMDDVTLKPYKIDDMVKQIHRARREP